ncbi:MULTISPECIES: hypothetical protein [Nocardia]|uniref:hypothetical protein n=1 Tax=Nocardia TaxID=1817 RepID=UPI00237E1717|nr:MULTISPECIES: hypothetical protein [Nocardia]MDE1674648.1 hypothetical protein [Nocardia gipuzkoensis]
MAENSLHIHTGNKQKTAAGTAFTASCVVQVTDSFGAGVDGSYCAMFASPVDSWNTTDPMSSRA